MDTLLGITGGVAVYKAPQLVRLFVEEGHTVRVILSERAKEFVTPLTLSTLSKNSVPSTFVTTENDWNSHVASAEWTDLMLIVPATANTIAKMAYRQCDNLLLATYLSAKVPVWVAPTMDLSMYVHPIVTHDLTQLQSLGYHVIATAYGELASGSVGQGRMAEPKDIVREIEDNFSTAQPLKGEKVLITAGPIYEAVDPVRFVGNFSTGKMDIALANEATKQGAEVHLILGPSAEKNINSHIHLCRVVSAKQMYEAAVERFSSCDIVILAAAAADYTPEVVAPEKIKKKGDNFNLNLILAVDILASLEKLKTTQKLIGFALETENGIENARTKLQKKHLDGIVLDSLRDKGAGFGTDTNKITFTTPEKLQEFPLKSKEAVAKDILTKCINL